MWRLLVSLLVVVFCVVGISQAGHSGPGTTVPTNVTQSKIIEKSSLITVGTGIFYGITVRTDGMDDATINIYDARDSSLIGRKLIPSDTVVSGIDFKFGFPLRYYPGIPFTQGIYVDIICAGTVSVQVLFNQ